MTLHAWTAITGPRYPAVREREGWHIQMVEQMTYVQLLIEIEFPLNVPEEALASCAFPCSAIEGKRKILQ